MSSCFYLMSFSYTSLSRMMIPAEGVDLPRSQHSRRLGGLIMNGQNKIGAINTSALLVIRYPVRTDNQAKGGDKSYRYQDKEARHRA